nr:hypothetical protein [Tanacetum cinerariifolium]
MIYHYKLGLAQVESRLVEHKDREIKYCKKIKGLEFRTESNNDYIEILKKELETLKKEKEGVDGKLAGFPIASKDLDNLIESQRSDKNKEGLGYSDVPPPPAQIYSYPKKDLSWTGLPEFADDTVTDYSRPSPTMKSTSGEDQNRNSSVPETDASPSTIIPKPFIKFVKPNDSPSESKTGKTETPKKPLVKYAEQHRKPNKKLNVRGNQRNWNNLKSHQLGPKFVMKKKACFNCGHFDHLSYDCRKRVKKGTSRSQNNTHEIFTHIPVVHIPYRPLVKLMRTNMNGAPPNRTSFNKQVHSYANKPFQRTSAVRSQFSALWVPTANNNFPPVSKKFSTVSRNFPTVNRKFPTDNRKFSTGGIKFSTADMGKKEKADSGCFRHMTGNISYLSDYEPFDGGYVSFGQGGCKITGKGTIKTDKLEFKNVYFVKDLKTLIEAARTMLADAKLPVTFWAEAVNTACYVQNRVLVNKSRNKTPYELFNGRTPAIGFLKLFGCYVMILNTLDNLGKIKEKGDEGYFIGYSMSSKEFRVFNKRTRRVEENLHVEFLENKAIEKGDGPNWLFDIDSLTKSMNYVPVDAGTISTNILGIKNATSQEVKKDVSSLRYIALPNWTHDALLESSSTDQMDDALLESSSTDQMETLTVESPIPTVSSPVPTACFTDSSEPSSDARLISKIVANQVETPSLDNILTFTNKFKDILRVTTNLDESNGVEADVSNMETTITASPTPTLRIHKDHSKSQIIGPVDTPVQIRNKSKEEEGIDYDEVFVHVARIEAIRLFLAYASFMGFTVYQMDVKSAFLYGTIDEEVYVMQPPGFQDPEGTIDQTLFIRRQRGDFILVQVYVDDIIFGSSNPQLCREFEALMHEKIQMSAMGELNFFLGLQVLQKKDGILLSQDKPDIMFAVCACARHQVTPKECHMHAVKRNFRYLKGYPKLGLWYPKESPFDLVAYSDSDYDGATQDHKSTTRGCQFLGRRLSMPCEALSREILSFILRFLRLIPLSEHTVDFHPMVDFVEASPLRRNLKLQDEEGISSLPDTKIFENLTLMGYNISPNQKFTFQMGQFSHQWKYLMHTIMQCLSPKSTGFNEFSSNIASALVCLATNKTYNFSKMIFDGLVKNVNNKDCSVFVLPPVADEPASPLRDVSQREACPTDSGFIADQDKATIAESSTLPYDSAPMVTSPAADEGKRSKDYAPIKGRNLDEGEAAAERVSDDTEEMATVLTSMDAATVLASGVAEVPTGSGSIPTVSPPAAEVPTGSDVVPTASPVFATATVVTLYRRRKGKEVMSQQRKPLTKKQQREFYTAVLRNHAGWKAKHFKGMTLEEIKENFDLVWKQLHDFVPIGSKEEAKRKVHTEEKGSYWNITSNRPPTSDKEIELWVELNRLYEPDEDDHLWTHTQNLMHAPVEWKLYDSCGVHHVTARDKEIFMLVEKDYPLKKVLQDSKGRIVGNKMHKAFPLSVIEFPLAEEVPTASEESSHCQKKRDATTKRIALLGKCLMITPRLSERRLL